MADPMLVLAGRQVAYAADRIRRYCGLRWSSGPPETWAYRYYDAVPDTAPFAVEPVDVVVTASLHAGLSREDLAFFAEEGERLSMWLRAVPVGADLARADDETVALVAGLADWGSPPGLALLSKVLHRKRRALVPLSDREIIDWYRPLTGHRSSQTGWGPLVAALRNDLRKEANQEFFTVMEAELAPALGAATPTQLRLLDIAVWMGGRK